MQTASGTALANGLSGGTKTPHTRFKAEQTERPKMKIQQSFAVLAIAMLQLLTASAQNSPTSNSSSGAAYKLSPGASEVAKLAQSGVGDDVVLSYIGQSQIYYNLSAADIVGLESAGVSSQAVTAMLNHDSALHNQQLAANPAASAASSTPATTAQPITAATTIVVTPPPAPAPQVEVIPVSPAPDYVWTPGCWSWDGSVWVWFGGYWGYPVRPGHVWHNGGFYHGRGVDVIRRHESVGGHRR
jgi:hypothetical protein